MPKHTIGGLEFYGFYSTDLPTTEAEIAELFDIKCLQAESAIEAMYEMVSKRRSALKGWKVALILKSLKAAYKLIHKL